jgi:DNA repair exonuclease SbcCD ATPase subunit
LDTQQQRGYADLCVKLSAEIANCSFRIEQTRENEKKAEKLRGQSDALGSSIKDTDTLIEKLKMLIEDVSTYTSDRRASSVNAVKQALMAAGNIVPASSKQIVFKMDQGEAWFETKDGLSLDRVEGSGYRATLSMFMRSVFMQTNPQYLQTLILDEIFAKLSPERSAILSTYLPLLGENIQIISIEQKPEVFSGLDCVSYNFFLDGDKTVVRKES